MQKKRRKKNRSKNLKNDAKNADEFYHALLRLHCTVLYCIKVSCENEILLLFLK